jgi:hypothetical protein
MTLDSEQRQCRFSNLFIAAVNSAGAFNLINSTSRRAAEESARREAAAMRKEKGRGGANVLRAASLSFCFP